MSLWPSASDTLDGSNRGCPTRQVTHHYKRPPLNKDPLSKTTHVVKPPLNNDHPSKQDHLSASTRTKQPLYKDHLSLKVTVEVTTAYLIKQPAFLPTRQVLVDWGEVVASKVGVQQVTQ